MGFVLIFVLGPGPAHARPAHTKPRRWHSPGPGPQNVGPHPRNLVFLCDTFKVGNRVVGHVGSVVQACKGPFKIVQACKGPFSIVHTRKGAFPIVQARKGPFPIVQVRKGPFPIVKIYLFVYSVLMFLCAPPNQYFKLLIKYIDVTMFRHSACILDIQ